MAGPPPGADVGVLTVHHEDESRRRARSAVSSTDGFEAVGEAASAEEAIELATALSPDLALVAAGMPGIDGFETSRRLIAARPATVVVVLFAAIEPKESTLANSGAVAALHMDALTSGSLQGLWERHRKR